MSLRPIPLCASLVCLGLASLGVAACSSTKNPVSEGAPIPNTDIVSCGDAVGGDQNAPPTANLSGMKIVATPKETTLEGELIWQFPCPKEQSSAQTYFSLTQIVLWKDDAGFPGDEIARFDVDLTSTGSCADRDNTQIGGGSKVDPFDKMTITSLADTCAARKKNPTGSPFYVQVGAVGKATTCSSDSNDLSPRSQVGVDCTGF